MMHTPDANHSKLLTIRPMSTGPAKVIRFVLRASGQLLLACVRNILTALCVVCRSFEMVYVDPFAQTKRDHDPSDPTRF